MARKMQARRPSILMIGAVALASGIMVALGGLVRSRRRSAKAGQLPGYAQGRTDTAAAMREMASTGTSAR